MCHTLWPAGGRSCCCELRDEAPEVPDAPGPGVHEGRDVDALLLLLLGREKDAGTVDGVGVGVAMQDDPRVCRELRAALEDTLEFLPHRSSPEDLMMRE